MTSLPSRSPTGMKISCVSLRFWCSSELSSSKRASTRLGFRLASLGVLPHPFQFLFHRLHVRVDLLVLGLQPRFLLLQPARVVALPRDAVAAVEFEYPFGGVVEEVAIVGDRDHGAGEAHEELFQPFHRFGVEVVGRFVQQQHVGFLQQQLAQRDAALLAAGEVLDVRIPRRQAQRVGGDLELVFGVGAGCGDHGFEPRLFGGERVEVGILFGIGGIHLVEFLLRGEHFAEALLHFLAHGVVGIELRFLRQVADGDVGLVLHLAVVFLVHAGHDAQHGGLARAVQAEQADLGAGEETQRDILDDLALRRNDLAHAEHRHYILGHLGSVMGFWKGRSLPQPDVEHSTGTYASGSDILRHPHSKRQFSALPITPPCTDLRV